MQSLKSHPDPPNRILIVEDDAVIAWRIERSLTSMGYRVVGTASTGDEAVILAEQSQPNLVLMDIGLRGPINGLEAAWRIHDEFDVPVIYLTAHTDVETIQRARTTRPYGYLGKPFEDHNLQAAIETAINLHQMERELRASEERFRLLFENMAQGAVTYSIDGTILSANATACRILGKQIDSLIGRTDIFANKKLVRPDKTGINQDDGPLKNTLLRGMEVRDVVVGISDQGHKTPLWITLSAVPIFRNNEPKPYQIFVTFDDITDRIEAEQNLAAYSRRLALLRSIDRAILQVESPEVIARTAIDNLQRLVSFDAAIIFRFDQTEPMAFTIASYGVLPDEMQIGSRFNPYHYFQTGKSSDPQRINLDENPNAFNSQSISNNAWAGYRTALWTDLIYRDSLIGALILVSTHPAAFQAVDSETVEEVADILSVAIQQSSLLDDARKRANELEALFKISSSLRQAETQKDLLNTLTTSLVDTLQADGVMFLLLEGDDLKTAFYDAGTLTHDVETDPIIWEVFRSGQALVIEDVEGYPNKKQSSLLNTAAIKSIAVVPLRTTHTTIGLFVVHYGNPHHFSAEEMRVILSAADISGNALHRVSLFSILEQRIADRTRELSALYDITALASEAPDEAGMFENAIRRILTSLSAQAAMVHRLDSRTGLFQLSTSRGIPAASQAIDQDWANWIVDSGKPYVVENTDTDLRSPTSHRLPGLCSFIVAPLMSADKAVGLLSVFKASVNGFRVDDAVLLNSITDLLGIATENFRLLEQAQLGATIAERQRLARELHDSVTQSIYSLTLLAQAGRDLLEEGEQQELELCLLRLENNAVQAMKEMRLLLFELRPINLQETGLVRALEARLDAVERRTGLQALLIAEPVDAVPESTQNELYRICVEALNNSLKHAKANRVQISIRHQEDLLQIEIDDDGQGFDQSQIRPGGFGIQSMQERARELGAAFDIDSVPGKGVMIRLSMSVKS